MKYFLLVIQFFCTATYALAQVGDPGFPGGDPDVPLDGGVGVLLAAGVYYGIKKIKARVKP